MPFPDAWLAALACYVGQGREEEEQDRGRTARDDRRSISRCAERINNLSVNVALLGYKKGVLLLLTITCYRLY